MKKAIIVISGKIFDKPFPFDNMALVFDTIEGYLKERDVCVTRRAVALSRRHSMAAICCMEAEVEVFPADEDEDVQAATFIMRELYSADAPDEVVFALGGENHSNFLRSLVGSEKKAVYICLPGENFAENIGHMPYADAIDLEFELKKAGYNWDDLRTLTWKEYAIEEGFPMVSAPTRPARRIIEATPSEPVLKTSSDVTQVEPIAIESQEDLSSEVEPEEETPTVEAVFAEEATNEKEVLVETPVEPEALVEEQDETEPEQASEPEPEPAPELKPEPAPEVELSPEEKKRLEYERFKASAQDWNDAIEKKLLAQGEPAARKCKLYDLSEELNVTFPGFYEFVWKREDDQKAFGKLLDTKRLRFAVDEQFKCVFHVSHPDMLPVGEAPTLDAVPEVDVEQAAASYERNGWTDDFSADRAREVAEMAKLRAEYCELHADAASRTLTPDETERCETLKNKGGFQGLSPAYGRRIDENEYRTLAAAYRTLAAALKLLADVGECLTEFKSAYVYKVLQSAANVQTIVKTYLRDLDVSYENECVQFASYRILLAYKQSCNEVSKTDPFINGLQQNDTLAVGKLPKVVDALEAYRKEFDRVVNTEKVVNQRLGELDAFVDAVAESPTDSHDEEWREIARIVEELCNMGVPKNSTKLRSILIKCVNFIPGDIETNKLFDDVVDEVVKMRDKDLKDIDDI